LLINTGVSKKIIKEGITMTIRELVPSIRGVKKVGEYGPETSLWVFQRDMNRLFDDFFGDFGSLSKSGSYSHPVAVFNPRVNIAETEAEVQISAELPGLDEKSVNIELDENTVTLKGEKRFEQDEKNKNWHCVESSYGSFQRVIGMPAGVDTGNAKARFQKGVLTITVPKREEVKNKRRTLEIESG